tara:strand:- start:797 stop:1321 length:525 start_codon:yes stop_codon:yes gene_type:complete
MISDILFVDLDGTLIKEDTLFFLTKKLVLKKPFKFLMILFKSKLQIKLYKTLLSRESIYFLSIEDFSLNKKALKLMQKYKDLKKMVILISGANVQIVNYFHTKLKLFDNFYGSNSSINLVGKQKVVLINEKYPNYSYDYLGNSSSDVPIWNDCNICYSVKAKKFSGLNKTLKII